jgi:phytoene/squalene synthetase
LDIREFNEECKKRIEEDIQKDFNDALEGIKKLPDECRIGVYLAYRYYIKLFKRIRKSVPQKLMEKRVRINNASKMYILLRSVARYQLNLL